MSEPNLITDAELSNIHAIQSREEERTKAERLPEWVKCAYCGGRPRWGDLLGQLIRHSTALAHQSCAKEHGYMFGINAGTLQEIGGVIKPQGDEQ